MREVIDLTNPKTRKALGIAVGVIVVLGLTGVLAGDQIVTVLSSLFAAAFGG